MANSTVAQYSYDQQGRLRAEWDRRVEPALKTTYGYDSQNRLVSISPSGQQPYLLSYGTTSGAAGEGWLARTECRSSA